jgi:hypothetical protein
LSPDVPVAPLLAVATTGSGQHLGKKPRKEVPPTHSNMPGPRAALRQHDKVLEARGEAMTGWQMLCSHASAAPARAIFFISHPNNLFTRDL